MAPKRKSDVGPGAGENEAGRASKISRTPALNTDNTSTGHRFGETADFIALPPLSQSFDFDEDDEGAADVVQGSQDESALTTSVLYGV